MTQDMLFRNATDLVSDMAMGRLSAVDLMTATLDRIERVNPSLTAVVALRNRADLLAEASAADLVPASERGPLHGLPMAVKDLANVAGLPTSNGSRTASLEPVDNDDLLVCRMRAAGVIFTGKTNVPELGLGSHSFNEVYGTTRNPYDVNVSAGGSSGGAAVALATGMQTIADGSDMMGSLRNPAAWNNVYGFRPTFGLVPNEPTKGPSPFNLSTLGPMARSVKDIALLLAVQAGDAPAPSDGSGSLGQGTDMAGARIGWLGDWGGALPFEDGILGLCHNALATLKGLGADVVTLDPPFSREAIWQSWTHLRAKACSLNYGPLVDDPATRDLIKQDAVWEVEFGRSLSDTDIETALDLQAQWARTADEMFDRFDVLIMPTTQVWPFKQTLPYPPEIAGVQMDTYHRWMETVIPVSLIGLPSLNVPIGFGDNGLAMGMQMIGRAGSDRNTLAFGQAWHAATGWPNAHPPKIYL